MDGEQEPQDPQEPQKSPRRVKQWAVAIAAAMLGLVALAVVIDFATASPQLCASCHEMAPRHETWTQSAHAEVSCVKCHQAPTQWYQLPARLAGRTKLLVRDVASHVKGDYTDPVDQRVPGSTPVQDEVCLQCHDANRKATSGFRILINHAEHAKRNGSCISCHVRTAHPIETRGTAISLMSQCFTCHGTAGQPKASANCRVCHPAGYELLPKSHTVAKWETRSHGTVAKADPKQCTMCHTKAFCNDCHGLAMPHPKGWEQGATGHAVVAETNRAVCSRCHGSQPDMCTMCHHDTYDPSKSTWVKQHFITARDRGVAQCLECHSPLYCVRCHVQ